MSSNATRPIPYTDQWWRVQARVQVGTLSETFGGLNRPFQDERVIDFCMVGGAQLLKAATTPYNPMLDGLVLKEFLRVFGHGRCAADEEIVNFYAAFGNIGDASWLVGLWERDEGELPQGTRKGLREPVWWVRELAAELELCCDLYRGLREDDPDLLRDLLGRVPASGLLVGMAVRSGKLQRIRADEEDLKGRVGSFGREWTESEDTPRRPMTDDEARGHACGVLRERVNHYEGHAARRWVDRTELPLSTGNPDHTALARRENPVISGYRTVVFDSLITALYLQLSDRIAEGGLLRRCRTCDGFYFSRRPNMHYCSTRCSTTYRRRQFTKRQQAKGPQDIPDAR
jgi:hypothetical protein